MQGTAASPSWAEADSCAGSLRTTALSLCLCRGAGRCCAPTARHTCSSPCSYAWGLLLMLARAPVSCGQHVACPVLAGMACPCSAPLHKHGHLLMCLDARVQCRMTWRPRFYLEDWFAKERCTPAGPGQADPELEEALAGCTAGAPFTSVPVGCSSNDVNQLGWRARWAASATVPPSL